MRTTTDFAKRHLLHGDGTDNMKTPTNVLAAADTFNARVESPDDRFKETYKNTMMQSAGFGEDARLSPRGGWLVGKEGSSCDAFRPPGEQGSTIVAMSFHNGMHVGKKNGEVNHAYSSIDYDH